uniref:Uncharacterized protein n=1 Tax=Romanomermis culicivorax TaxID=13658 RepID=A0A915KQU3_ROMCU
MFWKNISSFPNDDEEENDQNFTLSAKLSLLNDYSTLLNLTNNNNNELKIFKSTDLGNFSATTTKKSSLKMTKIDNSTIKINNFKNRNHVWRSEYTISLICTLIFLIICVLVFFACMKRYWRKIKPQSQSSVYSVQEGVFSDNMSLNFIDNPTDFVKPYDS